MGSGISAITTHADLYKKTMGTRRMVDDIFTYMMHHIKVNDFMKLSNPESCQKYALFMANNLSMFFSKLSVKPELGRDGVLAFRSIEELEEPKGPAKQEKESLCLVLAYFYTRIFQMYGAIALTLLDDINYTVEKSALMGARPVSETGLFDRTDLSDRSDLSIRAPGERYSYVEPRTPKQLRVDRMSGGQIGGWIPKLAYFDFLNQKLLVEQTAPVQQPYVSPYGIPYIPPAPTAVYTNQYGYTVNFVFKDQKQKYMYFKPEPADVGGRDVTAVSSQKGTFSWVDSQKKIFEIVVSVRKGVDDNHVQFSVDSIRFRKNRETTDIVLRKEEIREILSGNNPDDVVPDSITISSTQPFPSLSQTQSPQGQYETKDYADLTSYFKALFNTIIPAITKQYDSGDSIAGRSQMDAMNIRRFYENYTNVKPLGHCIARALQLLNADPYGRDEKGKEFVSSICKTSFFVPQGKTDAERRGVPKPDESITESPGIMSLALLFYDTVGKATPHIFMSNQSFEQYKVFMKQMAGLFMGKEAGAALHLDTMNRRDIHPKTAQQEKEKIKLTSDGKTEIVDRRTFDQSTKTTMKKGICSPEQKDKTIPLDGDTKQNVHGVVRQLFQRQMNHAAQCEKILRKLFTIERQENMPIRIKINDNILKGGLAALNRINAEVRQILIQYYSDCESMYLVGVRHIEHQGLRQAQAKAKAVAEAKAKADAEAKAKADEQAKAAQAQAQAAQGQVPRGPPVAATGPAPPKDALLPRGPPPTPEGASEWFTRAQKIDMQRRADAAQAKAAKAAQATATQPVAAPLTAAQQAAQRGQQSANKYAYIAAIEPILKDKFQGEQLAINTVQSVRTYLEGMSPRIPVEQLQAMTKDQLRGLVTQGSRMTRSRAPKAGGTRKSVTSSSHMTRRLLRQ